MASHIFVSADLDQIREAAANGKLPKYFRFADRYTANYSQSIMPDGWTVASKDGADAVHFAQELRDALAAAGIDASVTAVDPNKAAAVILSPVHLGTGEQGQRRRETLERLAAEAGHEWGGKPSIGRWLVAMADAEVAANHG